MFSANKLSTRIGLGVAVTGLSTLALTACGTTTATCDTSHLRHLTDTETYWDYAYQIGPHETSDQQHAVVDVLARLNHAPEDKSVQLGQHIVLPRRGDCSTN